MPASPVTQDGDDTNENVAPHRDLPKLSRSRVSRGDWDTAAHLGEYMERIQHGMSTPDLERLMELTVAMRAWIVTCIPMADKEKVKNEALRGRMMENIIADVQREATELAVEGWFSVTYGREDGSPCRLPKQGGSRIRADLLMGMRKPHNLSEKTVVILCKLGVAAMDTFLDTYATHKEAQWQDPHGERFANRMG